jgi:cation transport ATPase
MKGSARGFFFFFCESIQTIARAPAQRVHSKKNVANSSVYARANLSVPAMQCEFNDEKKKKKKKKKKISTYQRNNCHDQKKSQNQGKSRQSHSDSKQTTENQIDHEIKIFFFFFFFFFGFFFKAGKQQRQQQQTNNKKLTCFFNNSCVACGRAAPASRKPRPTCKPTNAKSAANTRYAVSSGEPSVTASPRFLVLATLATTVVIVSFNTAVTLVLFILDAGSLQQRSFVIVVVVVLLFLLSRCIC